MFCLMRFKFSVRIPPSTVFWGSVCKFVDVNVYPLLSVAGLLVSVYLLIILCNENGVSVDFLIHTAIVSVCYSYDGSKFGLKS